jgi:hypothetical protein
MAKGRIELVRVVSKRLLVAMLVLLAAILAVLLATAAKVGVPSLTLLLVFLAGQVGGYVGLQRRVKTMSLEDLELLATSWVYTVLSPLVGGILAIALYLVFVSELVTGQLFPVFEADSGASEIESIKALFSQHGHSYVDYAKLMVWSFIAGYSERFVVNVISSFSGNKEEA